MAMPNLILPGYDHLHQQAVTNAVVRTTSDNPILCLGADETITPLLHELCRAMSRWLVTITDSAPWYNFYHPRYYVDGIHDIYYVSARDINGWNSQMIRWRQPEVTWGLVYVSDRLRSDVAEHLAETIYEDANLLTMCIPKANRPWRANVTAAVNPVASSRKWYRRVSGIQTLLLGKIANVSAYPNS